MSEFEFGIGITASDEGAIKAFRGVISDMSSDLENSFDKFDLNEILGKGFDPSLLKFDDDAIKGLIEPLTDISEILQKISGDTGRIAGAFGDAGSIIEDTAKGADVLHTEICGVVICLDNAALAAAGFGDALSEIPQKAETTKEKFGKVGKAADLLSMSGSRLRHEQTRLNRAMGATSEEADLAASSILKMSTTNKVAWEKVNALSVALTRASIDMDALDKSGQRQMDTMIQLKETFELTDGEVASLAGSMKMTGGSVTDLAGVAVQFQKDFKIPGLLKTLPKAAKVAIDAQSQFESVVGRSSRSITVDILRMTTTYSRALGITAAEASNKARGSFMKFTSEIEHFEDLFLGIADDVSPLQMALLETGISMQSLERILHKGQKSPEEFARAFKSITANLDPQAHKRIMRLVIREVDEGTAKLITGKKVLENINKDLIEGAGKEPDDPSGTFNDIAKAMRENAIDAQAMHEALTGVASELGNLAMDEGVRRGLEDVNGLLQIVNTTLIDQYENVRKNKALFETYTTVIEGATAAFVGINDAWNAFTTVVGNAGIVTGGLIAGFTLLKLGSKFLGKHIGKLASRFGGFRNILSKFAAPFKWIIEGFKKIGVRGGQLGSALAGSGRWAQMFGKIIGKIALPIAVAIAAFDGIKAAVIGMGKIFSDPKKSGWEKFTGMVWEAIKGVGTAIDSFFLGIPGKMYDGMVAAAAAGEGGAEKIALGIIGAFAGIVDWAAGVGDSILGMFGLATGSIGPMFEIAFLSVQKTIHGWANWASDTFWAIISGWKMMLNKLDGWFDEAFTGIGTTIEVTLARALSAVIGKFVETIREYPSMAKLFGLDEEEIAGFQMTQAKLLAGARTLEEKAEETHKEKLAQIAEETEARNKEIIAEQKTREAATAEWAAHYDGLIAEREEKISALAAEADQAAIAKQTKAGVSAVEDATADKTVQQPKGKTLKTPDTGIEPDKRPSPTTAAPKEGTASANQLPDAAVGGLVPAGAVAASAGTAPSVAAMAATGAAGTFAGEFSPIINNRFVIEPGVNSWMRSLFDHMEIKDNGQGY